MNHKIYLIVLLMATLISCSRNESLNFRYHETGQLPTKIVWIQVAGLDMSQLGLLKYGLPSADLKTSFERSSCIGQVWTFDNFALRPKAEDGLWGQTTGKANIKGDCSDLEHKAIWEYWDENSIKAGVLEISANKNEELSKFSSCKDQRPEFFPSFIHWKMAKDKGKKGPFFQFQEQQSFKKGKTYYDLSCQRGKCFSNALENIRYLMKDHFSTQNNFLFLIRDFSLLRNMEKRDIFQAREGLSQIEKIYNYFINLAEKRRDMLVLLTSTAPNPIELPKIGKAWEVFERKGKFVNYRLQGLVAPVFSYGARAENFCGIYEQSDLLKRITESPTASRGEKIRNIFR
jgi:hypothetical protein